MNDTRVYLITRIQGDGLTPKTAFRPWFAGLDAGVDFEWGVETWGKWTPINDGISQSDIDNGKLYDTDIAVIPDPENDLNQTHILVSDDQYPLIKEAVSHYLRPVDKKMIVIVDTTLENHLILQADPNIYRIDNITNITNKAGITALNTILTRLGVETRFSGNTATKETIINAITKEVNEILDNSKIASLITKYKTLWQR